MRDTLQQFLFRMECLERDVDLSSPLHRLDARAKVVVTVAFLSAMLSVPLSDLPEILLFFVFPVQSAFMGALRYSSIFRRSLIVLPFAVFIGLFDVFYQRQAAFAVCGVTISRGWVQMSSIVLRGLLSVQALLVLVSSTGYYRLCRSLQRLGLPSLFVTQLLLVYRYIYVLVEQGVRMSRAVEARSFGRRSYPVRLWGVLVGGLMIRTFDRAEKVGRAMLSRGFTGNIPFCCRQERNWRTADTVYTLFWILAFVCVRVFHPARRLAALI